MAAPELEPTALTTVEAALRFLKESDDPDSETRDALVDEINSWSTIILDYIGRQFLPVENDVDKLFAYEGNGFLSLAPFEARDITTVTMYTDLPEEAWVVLLNQDVNTESQWRANPRHKTKWGTYTYLTVPEVARYNVLVPEPLVNRRNRRHQVTVHGDWGVGTIPGGVERACLIAIADAWRNPEGFQTRQLGPLSFTEPVDQSPDGDEDGYELPRKARLILKPYKRNKWGAR